LERKPHRRELGRSVHASLCTTRRRNMCMARASLVRAFRNLTQRTQRKATEITEGLLERGNDRRRKKKIPISLWFSVVLCVLCVELFGIYRWAKFSGIKNTCHQQPITQNPLPPLYLSRMRERNSSRVCTFSRNAPSMALVTVCEFCFSTPRITMHRCRASTTTPTPNGAIFCWMALAI